MANTQYLDQEGLQLKIVNNDGFEVQLFWNHDSVDKTIEKAENDEFYLHIQGYIGTVGIDFSLDDAVALRDTLDHMIKKLSK